MDKKKNPDARMNGQDNIERLTDELYKKKESVSGSDLDDWLKAERIVAEWLKNREEAEHARDAQEDQPGA